MTAELFVGLPFGFAQGKKAHASTGVHLPALNRITVFTDIQLFVVKLSGAKSRCTLPIRRTEDL